MPAVLREGGPPGTVPRAAPPPLPVFRSACWITNKLLARVSIVPRLVRLLGVQRGRPAPASSVLSDTSSMRTG